MTKDWIKGAFFDLAGARDIVRARRRRASAAHRVYPLNHVFEGEAVEGVLSGSMASFTVRDGYQVIGDLQSIVPVQKGDEGRDHVL